MTKVHLEVLINQLAKLCLENVEGITFDDLEWILADFVLSRGQRLLINPENWPPPAQRTHLHEFGVIYLPFATAADFPTVFPNQTRTLGMAMACLGLYIGFLDQMVDEPYTSSLFGKVAIQHVLMRFYRLLGQVFMVDSPFWGEVEQIFILTSRAIVDEHEAHRGTVCPFSTDEFRRIAYGTLSIARVSCVGLSILNNTPERIPVLNECWNAISLAATVRDDVLDWREDYNNANYTYLLSKLLLSPPFRADVEAGHFPDVEEIGAALFCTDLIESLYELTYEALAKAVNQATEISCHTLAGLLRCFQAKTASRRLEMSSRKLTALLAMSASAS